MTSFSFDAAPVPVRAEVADALPYVWSRIGQPGTWLDAGQRVAVAAETRHARRCALCAERKAALSPYAVDGTHDNLGELPDIWVDVIHRIVSDPGRLVEHWFREATASGIGVEEYVELVGIVAVTTAVDTLCRGIGLAAPDLPAPQPGSPTGETPEDVDRDLAWVPTLSPEPDGPLQREFYRGGPAHIRRALTYVPETARDFWRMANTLYLSSAEMRDFDHEFRAITHAQIELVAGRVSAINQCVY